MPYVYLGFTSMLNDILTGLFNEVLAPVIEAVFNWVISFVGGQLWELFSDIFMDGFIILLKCVNFLESMFNLFAGLGVVTYKGQKGKILLDVIFELDGISGALAITTFAATAMAFFFALYATAKTISDSTLSDGRPITYIFQSGFKAAITFMLVPFLCICLLRGSSLLLDNVVSVFNSKAVSGNEQAAASGIDDMLFITASSKAAKNEDAVKTFSSGHKYADRDKVKDNFKLDKVDYLIGYVSTILVLLVMLGSCLSFIRRIFDLLILYLVSPFFTATIVLDGGGRFSRWREVFVAKFFSGFGSIFVMKLYLMVIPFINNSDLSFSGDTSQDGYIRMILVIGGAWALYKGQHTMLQLLSPDAAAAASQSSGAMVALAIGGLGKAAGGAVSGTRSLAHSYKAGKRSAMAPKE